MSAPNPADGYDFRGGSADDPTPAVAATVAAVAKAGESLLGFGDALRAPVEIYDTVVAGVF